MALPEVGDLAVMIKAPCTCSVRFIGRIFSVLTVDMPDRVFCAGCGTILGTDSLVNYDGTGGYMLRYLRRIPPLSDLESLSDFNDIPVPAEIRGLTRRKKEPA